MRKELIEYYGKLLIENNMPGWSFRVAPAGFFPNPDTIAHCMNFGCLIIFNEGYSRQINFISLEKILLHEMAHSVHYNHKRNFKKLAAEMGGFNEKSISKEMLNDKNKCS